MIHDDVKVVHDDAAVDNDNYYKKEKDKVLIKRVTNILTRY